MPPDPFAWIKGRPIELFIESFSNAARTLQVRGFTLNEQIIADHTTNSDRSLATSTVPLTGIPIFLTVTLPTAGVSRGECYVRISVRVEGVVVAILGAGYVSDTGTIVFPGGKVESSIEGPGLIRSITGTNPPVNTNISETVPTGARWKLLSMQFTLITDANAADRLVQVVLTDGSNILQRLNNQTLQTANQTVLQTLGLGIGEVIELSGVEVIPAPGQILLGAGFVISTVTFNIQAGDNYSAPQLLVEEWIEP